MMYLEKNVAESLILKEKMILRACENILKGLSKALEYLFDFILINDKGGRNHQGVPVVSGKSC